MRRTDGAPQELPAGRCPFPSQWPFGSPNSLSSWSATAATLDRLNVLVQAAPHAVSG